MSYSFSFSCRVIAFALEMTLPALPQSVRFSLVPPHRISTHHVLNELQLRQVSFLPGACALLPPLPPLLLRPTGSCSAGKSCRQTKHVQVGAAAMGMRSRSTSTQLLSLAAAPLPPPLPWDDHSDGDHDPSTDDDGDGGHGEGGGFRLPDLDLFDLLVSPAGCLMFGWWEEYLDAGGDPINEKNIQAADVVRAIVGGEQKTERGRGCVFGGQIHRVISHVANASLKITDLERKRKKRKKKFIQPLNPITSRLSSITRAYSSNSLNSQISRSASRSTRAAQLRLSSAIRRA